MYFGNFLNMKRTITVWICYNDSCCHLLALMQNKMTLTWLESWINGTDLPSEVLSSCIFSCSSASIWSWAIYNKSTHWVNSQHTGSTTRSTVKSHWVNSQVTLSQQSAHWVNSQGTLSQAVPDSYNYSTKVTLRQAVPEKVIIILLKSPPIYRYMQVQKHQQNPFPNSILSISVPVTV